MTDFRNAFVTGASSGIGRALALELARAGTHVVATARRTELLEELVAEIQAAGGTAEWLELDVSDTRAVQDVVRAADERAGGFDLVVANAGVGAALSPRKIGWDTVAEVLQVNVVGAIATLTAALPLMRERDRGTLAGVSSLASVRGMPASGAYSASKAALATFLESLQIDMAHTNVRVVDVQPGFVRTAMTEHNSFPMPFLMDVEDAARKTVRGLGRAPRVVTYPWPLSLPTRHLVPLLPRAVWHWLARRAVRK